MIILFEQYRNKEQLKIEILKYLKDNTNINDKLCVDTQTIAYNVRIRSEYCFKLLKELLKEKRITHLNPINKNNFNCADWIYKKGG